MLLTSNPLATFHNEEIHSYEQYAAGNEIRFISASALLARTMFDWFGDKVGKEPVSTVELARNFGIGEPDKPLFAATLQILDRAGYLVITGESVRKAQFDEAELNGLVTGLKTEGLATYRKGQWLQDAVGPALALTLSCIPRLPEFFRGETTGLQILFSPANYSLSMNIYGGHFQQVYYDLIAERIVAQCYSIWDREPNRKVHILEIGAGSGKGSVRILEGLRGHEDKICFCFTDIGNSFLRRAKKIFRSFECEMEFRLLDISKELKAQDFAENDFDIVFATNVLHATQDLRTTLSNAYRLLVPGGSIFVNEIVADMAANTLSYGMTPGWWLATDGLRLPLSPVATSNTYRHLMTEIGFQDLAVVGYPGVPEKEQVQAIIKGTKKLSQS
jgi:SAM-dependent methyltransferase